MRRVARERWWLTVVILAVFVGVAAAFDLQTRTAYTSTAEISVAPAGLRAPLAGVRPLPPPTAAEVNGRVGRLMARPVVHRRVAKRLRGKGVVVGPALVSPSEVRGWVRVSALAASPGDAATIANSYAEVLASELSFEDRLRLDEVVRTLRRQRRQIRRTLESRADPLRSIYLIDIQISRLRVLRRVGRTTELAVRARAEEADAIRPGKRTLGAAVLGLSLGIVAAFAADALTRRPRSPSALAAATGLPIAGVVPRQKGGAATAYDVLRAAVEAAIVDAHLPVVAVTSCAGDDGCGAVASGIARSAVNRGEEVRLVRVADRPPLQELAATSNLVVVEAGGLLASADAVDLTGRSAVVLLCVRAGRTSVDEIAAAQRAVACVHGADVRLVVTGVVGADRMKPAGGDGSALRDEEVPA